MIDKLEFVIALAREQHFGRAADACRVTQPTLSAGLKQLEDILGVRLVNRGSRFQSFTPEGERVLDWARRIVADSRAMKQEVDAFRRGITGILRIAAIPTALPMVSALTTPFRARYPAVRFTILSRTSNAILSMLDNLEIDAGISYLDNEPLGRVRTIPLYQEEYRLLTSADSVWSTRSSISWEEAGTLSLCLLSPDMQNRRIIDELFRSVGVEVIPTLESDSMTVLISHVRTGQWSSIMSKQIADSIAVTARVKAIPITAPSITHTVGLVIPRQEPLPLATTALAAEARKLAAALKS